jgi:CBS domain-containing protein
MGKTKISDVMTSRPRAITPQTSVREAARLMEQEDVGSLPIVEDGARLVGIVTDRDVVVRVVSRGLDPEQTRVAEVASQEVYVLSPDDDLDEALSVMARAQVRRLPIVVRDNELVGMVAQADIARSGKDKPTGEVVEAISRPGHGPRVAGPDDRSDRGDYGDEGDRDEGDRDDRARSNVEPVQSRADSTEGSSARS